MNISITEIEKFVFSKLDDMSAFHTREVREIGAILAEQEKADKTVVDVALLFHDIGRSPVYFTGMIDHAADGAKVAQKFMMDRQYPKDFIEKVVHCVRAHSSPWAKNAEMPQTKEAKVVYDADIIHHFTNYGIVGEVYLRSKLKWKDMLSEVNKSFDMIVKTLQTRSGKRMGRPKYEIVKEFFSKLS